MARRKRRARLDLDHNERVFVTGNDIDLTRATAPVAVDDLIPTSEKIVGCDVFAAFAQ
jgi:hypothetical protein